MDYLIIGVTEVCVTAARFTISGRTTVLDGAASFALGDGADLSAAASQIASGISGAPRVVVCLPPALFAHRTVELPLTDLRKVREILPAHLQGEIALPAEEAVFDVLPLSDGKCIVLWAQRSEIARFVDLFRGAGCEPHIISSAVFSWPHLPGIPTDCVVSDGDAVAVIAEGRLSYLRALEGDGHHTQLSATLSALELSGAQLPSRFLVFGEQSVTLTAMDGLPRQAEQMELPDEHVTIFRTETAFQQLAGLYAVVCACHARELPDFRRGDLVWTAGSKKVRRQLILTGVLTALVVVLLFVYQGLQYRAARADLASLNRSISSLYREIFPGRTKPVDELAEVKGELRKLSGAENSAGVLELLRKLAEAKGVTIHGLFEAELEGRTLRVKGDARSAQAVNEFKVALAGVKVTSEPGEIKSRPDGTVSFSLSGTLKEAGK